MKNLKLSLISALAIALLAGCQPNDPELGAGPAPLPAIPPEKPLQSLDKHFDFARSESTVQQDKYDENTVTAFFTMNNGTQSVNDLKPGDIKVTENGRSVTQFSLSADRKHTEEVVDIALAVDVTTSMGPFIESAKRRLKDFINSSRDKNYHTRICITTFGDYTVKPCTRFFDTTVAAQANELLTELAALHNFTGKDDPGGTDLDENPMRNLIDLASAPWAPSGQRFVILVTDAGFLYLPNHEGDASNPGNAPEFFARNKVPRMGEVTQAIKSSQMKIFAVTRTQHFEMKKMRIFDGYNTPFQGEPGIVQSSGGEYFNFDDVIAGKITLDTILQRILNRIDTTYKLTYVVDKNPGLDVTLPQAKRSLVIAPAVSSLGTVKLGSVVSSIPDGRPEYKQQWRVADNAIDQDSLHVSVDGVELSRSDVTVSGGDVKFATVPKAGAKIKFSFYYRDIEKNFRIEPLTFRGVLNPATTHVYLNGIEAKTEDVVIARDLEGNSSLKLADSALATDDPYAIRKSQGVTIHVVTK